MKAISDTLEGEPKATLAQSEVKGVWFVSARRYALEEHGGSELLRVIDLMKPAHRHALEAPMTSVWYPEEAMQDAFAAAKIVFANGSDEKMIGLFERCTLIGVNHFWRIALRVTTTEFALRMLPATWRHMRRGPGTMAVEIDGGQHRRATVRYARFPYFDDVNYRSLVVGSLRPLLRISTGTAPRVTITGFGASWLDADLEFPRFG